jgi:hypothetical protein
MKKIYYCISSVVTVAVNQPWPRPADRLGSGRGAATFQIETTGRKTPT